jgi:L-asparaginase
MEKKKILIIATGGTIAGNSPDGKAAVYTAGQQDIDEILQSVPLIHTLADLKMETVCRKDSNDIGMEDLFAIKAICEKAQLDPEIDGIVITHGTAQFSSRCFQAGHSNRCDAPGNCDQSGRTDESVSGSRSCLR